MKLKINEIRINASRKRIDTILEIIDLLEHFAVKKDWEVMEILIGMLKHYIEILKR